MTNGFAVAPPGSVWKTGVSTSTKPLASRKRRTAEMARLRAEQDLAASFVGPHVGVTLAVAGIDVGYATQFVTKRAAGLGKQGPLAHSNRQLARPGADDLPGSPDPVPEGKLVELGEPRCPLRAGEQLQRAGPIGEREEGQLSHLPPQHDPPGDRGDLSRIPRSGPGSAKRS